MPQRKLVAGAAVPAAMRLPAPVLSTAFAALEQVRGPVSSTSELITCLLPTLLASCFTAVTCLEQRKLAAISISSAEVQEGAEEGVEACVEVVQEAASMPAAMRLPSPVTAEEVSAQLATISSEIDGYISLPPEAKLPAPLLAAAFREYEAYAGRPPADEHEVCA